MTARGGRESAPDTLHGERIEESDRQSTNECCPGRGTTPSAENAALHASGDILETERNQLPSGARAGRRSCLGVHEGKTRIPRRDSKGGGPAVRCPKPTSRLNTHKSRRARRSG